MPKDLATSLLVPGELSPERKVPASIPRPEYVGRPAPAPYDGPNAHDEETVARIAAASRLAADALEHLEPYAVPGTTTDELDAIAHEFLVERGAYPSCLGYRGFPKSVCTSLEEVICHGIPDSTALEDGDILNVDITAYLDGVHGDTNRMFLVGDVAEEKRLLVERTHEAMLRGIKAARPGRTLNIVGCVIESYAKRFGYGVVRDYTGHGVGPAFHTGLIVPHWDDPSRDDVIEPGMVFTVEPMLTLGGGYGWRLWDDDWTVVTDDGSATAQWEHTVVVREDGPEILTLPSSGRRPNALPAA